METRKKHVILALCVVAFAGIVFAVLKFEKTKKTVSVSVSEMNKGDFIENKSMEPISNNQSSVIGNQEEKINVNDEQTPVANNQAEKITKPAVEEEVAEKKTVEPEKTVETKNEIGKIIDKLVSWGFTKSSDRKIDTVIIHSSYDSLGKDPYSVSGIIEIYKQYAVSAHYLIDRGGVVYRLVSDQNIAWHAGVSKMPDGRTNVNSFSIGVEMINTKDGKYTDEQYRAVNSLIASLKQKYVIKNILGHNEIAPGRKTDPWGMEWKKVNK